MIQKSFLDNMFPESEVAEFLECEKVIEGYIEDYLKWARFLRKVRAKRLWRLHRKKEGRKKKCEYESFEDYCLRRWNLDLEEAEDIIAWSQKPRKRKKQPVRIEREP